MSSEVNNMKNKSYGTNLMIRVVVLMHYEHSKRIKMLSLHLET